MKKKIEIQSFKRNYIRSQDRAQMMKMREKQVADRRMRDYIDQKPNIDEELFDAADVSDRQANCEASPG